MLVALYTSPPVLVAHSGSGTATTTNLLNTNLLNTNQHCPPSGSRGEGLAVIGPNYPDDRTPGADNGSQVGPQRADPRVNSLTTARRDENQDESSNPAQRREGSENRPVPLVPQRRTGERTRLKIASLNIKGRNSGVLSKWHSIPRLMRDKRIGILAVQETHLTEDLALDFERLFGNAFWLIHSPDPESTNARGVAFVLNKSLVATDDVKTEVVVPGRAIVLSVPWKSEAPITALNIYAPNCPQEAREFWKTVRDSLERTTLMKPNVLLGDFNLVEDALDRIPSSLDDPQTTERLKEVRTRLDLIDGWRKANEEEKGYTWSRPTDGTQS